MHRCIGLQRFRALRLSGFQVVKAAQGARWICTWCPGPGDYLKSASSSDCCCTVLAREQLGRSDYYMCDGCKLVFKLKVLCRTYGEYPCSPVDEQRVCSFHTLRVSERRSPFVSNSTATVIQERHWTTVLVGATGSGGSGVRAALRVENGVSIFFSIIPKNNPNIILIERMVAVVGDHLL